MFEEFSLRNISVDNFFGIQLENGDLYFGEIGQLMEDGSVVALSPSDEVAKENLKNNS